MQSATASFAGAQQEHKQSLMRDLFEKRSHVPFRAMFIARREGNGGKQSKDVRKTLNETLTYMESNERQLGRVGAIPQASYGDAFGSAAQEIRDFRYGLVSQEMADGLKEFMGFVAEEMRGSEKAQKRAFKRIFKSSTYNINGFTNKMLDNLHWRKSGVGQEETWGNRQRQLSVELEKLGPVKEHTVKHAAELRGRAEAGLNRIYDNGKLEQDSAGAGQDVKRQIFSALALQAMDEMKKLVASGKSYQDAAKELSERLPAGIRVMSPRPDLLVREAEFETSHHISIDYGTYSLNPILAQSAQPVSAPAANSGPSFMETVMQDPSFAFLNRPVTVTVATKLGAEFIVAQRSVNVGREVTGVLPQGADPLVYMGSAAPRLRKGEMPTPREWPVIDQLRAPIDDATYAKAVDLRQSAHDCLTSTVSTGAERCFQEFAARLHNVSADEAYLWFRSNSTGSMDLFSGPKTGLGEPYMPRSSVSNFAFLFLSATSELAHERMEENMLKMAEIFIDTMEFKFAGDRTRLHEIVATEHRTKLHMDAGGAEGYLITDELMGVLGWEKVQTVLGGWKERLELRAGKTRPSGIL